MTIAQVVARAREALLAGGVPADEAPGDAEVLARHALDWDLTRYAIGRGDAAPRDFSDRYDRGTAGRRWGCAKVRPRNLPFMQHRCLQGARAEGRC